MTPRRQFTGYMTGRNNCWLSITGTAEAAATNGPPLYECPAEKFNAGWQRASPQSMLSLLLAIRASAIYIGSAERDAS